MDLGPALNIVLWCVQLLTATVILVDTYTKWWATHDDVRRRSRKEHESFSLSKPRESTHITTDPHFVNSQAIIPSSNGED